MAVTSIDAKGVHIRKLMPSFKEDSNTWETMADMLVRGGPYVCWYCKAVARGASMEAVRAPSTPCKKCARCHEAQYCSTDCQRAHWKKGHKRTCGLKDPCPICLERPASAGPNNFMCFVCGWRCCGSEPLACGDRAPSQSLAAGDRRTAERGPTGRPCVARAPSCHRFDDDSIIMTHVRAYTWRPRRCDTIVMQSLHADGRARAAELAWPADAMRLA